MVSGDSTPDMIDMLFPVIVLTILEENWWTSNGNIKHYVRVILHIVKEDRLGK